MEISRFLTGVFTDPDFDPSQHAVYYVRVIEIPTPRWSTYDAKELGVEPLDDVPATIQERDCSRRCPDLDVDRITRS